MNPLRLKASIEEACQKAGVSCPKVAAVVGDDVADRIAELRGAGRIEKFGFLGELESLWPDDAALLSCNAYFGALPIAAALSDGAQIVVTGRCVDSALTLGMCTNSVFSPPILRVEESFPEGPLIYEFGWRPEQFDLLSSGSLAGHIIECGAQATGGNFTDWRESSKNNGWHNIGFPIVEWYGSNYFFRSLWERKLNKTKTKTNHCRCFVVRLMVVSLLQSRATLAASCRC